MSTQTDTALTVRPVSAEFATNELRWRVLRLLNLFRAIAAGVFTLLFFQDGSQPFGSQYPQLYLVTGIAYFGLALIASFTLRARWPSQPWQTYGQLFGDVAAVALMTHASGGQTSGLASLLFITVAAGSILMRQRGALAYAALATLALLGEQMLSQLAGVTGAYGYTNSGIMGAIFFATAVVGGWIAERFRESEALATRRGVDLANLSQVNNLVIQNLRTGVVVLDEENRIRQINAAAMRYLDLSGTRKGQSIDVSPALSEVVERWRSANENMRGNFRGPDGTLFIPTIQTLNGHRDGSLMIFLEDGETATEEIQQMKLAALGRLTASIAHEIRNPIGAISHAGQLLEESGGLDADDKRFLNIIREQSGRVNEIIENILQLGRRERVQPERLEITSWLRDFVMECCDTQNIALDAIELDTTGEEVYVRVDPGHLRQILLNLVQNARIHAGFNASGELVKLRLTQSATGSTAWLDVVDFGRGVPSDIVDRVFEPFYTHSRTGTGLGLFIARELCECNHASLKYGQDGDGRSCFRIRFQDENAWLT
ncbi:MAG TPA: HAMP domain-containing sensor histidine kinase [Gammaproteobacteria bacterium]